jgi:serine/threonine-protein phosphatase 2B catalytic subunit
MTAHHPVVTDMLIAILNCCTKEELEEAEEEEPTSPEVLSPADEGECEYSICVKGSPKLILCIIVVDIELDGRDNAKMKNKIMLVGKMSRVFALLR